MKKRIYSVIMICVMVCVCGCGTRNQDVSASVQSKEYVYSFASLNEKFSDMELSQAFYAGERILLTSYRYEEVSMGGQDGMENPEMEFVPEMEFMPEEEFSEDMPVEEVLPEDEFYEDELFEEEFYEEEVIEDVEAVEEIAVEEVADAVEEIAVEEVADAVEEIAVEEVADVVEEVAVEAGGVVTAEVAVAEDVFYDDMYFEDMYYEDMYYEEYTQNTYFKVTQVDLTGEVLSEFEILMPSESGISTMCADEDGNIYMILMEYGKDTTNPEVYKDLFTLIAYSGEGEELWRQTLGQDLEAEDWYYVNQMYYSPEGLILFASTNGIEMYYKDGTYYKTIELQESMDGNMYMLRDGKPALLVYGNRGMYMKTLDIETEEMSERIEFPFNAYEYNFYTGNTTDLLLSNTSGVYTYNFEDEGLQKVLDFVDSDLLSNNLYSLVQTGEKQLFGCFYDYETGMTQFGFFNKVDPSTIKDKKVLTLACYWLDDDVRRRVVDYNKTSEEYRIRIEDYSRYNTTDDYTMGMTKLNPDIASGNAPDIVMVSSDMPVDSYISKGLFADLNAYLEKDPELKKEDYMENIMEVFSQDGKWYQLVPSYYLYTIFGKASEVGEEPGWTLEELQALRETKDEDVAVFSELTKDGVLSYMMLFASDQFIDWETGECSFESEEFIELLEFANEFPTEFDYSEMYDDPDYWEQQETMFRDGRALLMPYTISNFQEFQYCEEGTFGEQITAVGFPVKEGVGNVIMANSNFAISAKSPYGQEAWEFLRYYLTAEYQDTIEYGWPVLKRSLEQKMEQAQEKPYYLDENGEKVEYEETYYIGGMEIVMETLSKEDCERVVSFLNSAKDVYSYDQAIMNIVYEETASYFDGQKTAEEVADIIQSRIFIYVNENR